VRPRGRRAGQRERQLGGDVLSGDAADAVGAEELAGHLDGRFHGPRGLSDLDRGCRAVPEAKPVTSR
jgi:hypothetical protein